MRKLIVVGNWKMNGSCLLVSDFSVLIDGVNIDMIDVVICFLVCYLFVFENVGFVLGGQMLSELDNGVYMGDILVDMLKEFGCQYVIVGYLECCEDYGESNELVVKKVFKVIENDFVFIVCVGESFVIREVGELEDFLVV